MDNLKITFTLPYRVTDEVFLHPMGMNWFLSGSCALTL